MLEAALPLGFELTRARGLPRLEALGPARKAAQPGHAERGITHLDMGRALALLRCQQAFGLHFQTRQGQLKLALRCSLCGLECELPLQAGICGLQVQRLNGPLCALPLALQVQFVPAHACWAGVFAGGRVQIGCERHRAGALSFCLNLSL